MVPAPLGATFCTNEPVELSRDAEKLLHSGAICNVPTRYTLPVNFAGASGGTCGLYRGSPLTC